MKAMVWTCDRCRCQIEVPRLVVHDEEYGTIEHGCGNPAWTFGPSGWRKFEVEGTILDVCPACVTDAERADAVLAEVEADYLSGLADEGRAKAERLMPDWEPDEQ